MTMLFGRGISHDPVDISANKVDVTGEFRTRRLLKRPYGVRWLAGKPDSDSANRTPLYAGTGELGGEYRFDKPPQHRGRSDDLESHD